MISDRVQYLAARLTASLPDRVKLRLAGEAPIVIDGQTLDAQLQLIRRAQRRRNLPGLLEPTIEAGRRRYRTLARVYRGPVTRVREVRNFDIPAPHGRLPVRLYVPPPDATRGRAPLTVYLHGGGFVIGDLDTHDEPCRILCRESGTHVLSVQYRLAPEHPFPAAVEDAQTAFAWARDHAAELAIDADDVAIGGDSAGANLSAVVSATTPVGQRPAAQLLIYPTTDASAAGPSLQRFDAGFFLSRRDRDRFLHHYTGDGRIEPADPRLSPLRATTFAHIPPTLMAIAGFDILRDEGEEFAAVLKDAGTPVTVQRHPSLTHGFLHMTGVCPAARTATIAIARAWRETTPLARGSARQPATVAS